MKKSSKTMKPSVNRFPTSAKRWIGQTELMSSSQETRRRLPSEAFAVKLLQTPLPKKKVKVQARSVLLDKALKEAGFYVKGYSPAPTVIGATPFSRTDLLKTQEQICKDRQVRREVLFAKKLAGKGSSVKEAQWTLSSLMRCK